MKIQRGTTRYESIDHASAKIGAIEILAAEAYLEHIQEIGGIRGTIEGENPATYYARIVPASEVGGDIQNYVGRGDKRYYVEELHDADRLRTSVFNLNAGRGVHRDVAEPLTVNLPEYHEEGADMLIRTGDRLLQELFVPGSYPELAELAAIQRACLLGEDELPVRVMTEEERVRSSATARLGSFTMAHLDGLEEIYHDLAFLSGPYKPRNAMDQAHLHSTLIGGGLVVLDTGTRYSAYTRQEFAADTNSNQLKTRIDLNYDIPIGPVKLQFDEDIGMAVAYGEQAAAYFKAQGIAA